MCQKRMNGVKKEANHVTRLRQIRRAQRLQRNSPPPTDAQIIASQAIDKAVQDRVILALTWKTMALMYKNKLIQQKIIDLQNETALFVATVLNDPENQKRFMANFHQRMRQQQTGPIKVEPNNNDVKVEPNNNDVEMGPNNVEVKMEPNNVEVKVEPNNVEVKVEPNE